MSETMRYAIKKLLIGVPTVIVLTLTLFLLLQLIPGDPVSLLVPDYRNVPKEKLEELRHQYGLDKPVIFQYFYWLSHFLQGDFGKSFVTKMPVSLGIIARLPYTLKLTVSSIILAYVLGLPLGVISALKRGTKIDSFLMNFSVLLYSMPRYWLALIFMIVFGLRLRWLPISGIHGGWSMVLPTLTLALPTVAFLARLMRTEMVEVLREDYIRTAWAKGLHSRRVIWWHAFRNALIPVVVLLFMQLPWLIGGAIVIEAVFAWPGLGQLLFKSIQSQDFPVVQAIIFFISIFTVISNILGDIASAYLDPRIRVEK